jgi:FkbM family methyltransferase
MDRSLSSAHYSQWGEDAFVAKILTGATGFYVDIGSNHPTHSNNSYLFYRRGWCGLCIDPHARFAPMYAATRPRDRFLNLAVSQTDGEVEFYVGDNPALSSLYPSELNPTKTTVRSKPLGAILKDESVPLDFELLSVDVEGAETEVLGMLDVSVYRPRVIVAEYQTNGQINTELQPFLIGRGYQIISVTRCNVIATACIDDDWAVKRGLAT